MKDKTPFERIIKGGYTTPEKFRAMLAERKGCKCLPDMQMYGCKAGEYCIHKITPPNLNKPPLK